MIQNLASVFFKRASEQPLQPAVSYKALRGPYQDISWQAYEDLVNEFAFGLAALGLKPKEAVGIFSGNSHLWVAADIATMANGAVTVPVYPTSSTSDLEYILSNSGARIVFVQNETLLAKVADVSKKLPQLTTVVIFNPPSKAAALTELAYNLGVTTGNGGRQLITLDEFKQSGREFRNTNKGFVEARTEKVRREDLATIIYTSGTTGVPKGAELTHGNILSVCESLVDELPINEDDVYLSYLPLSHVFERVCGEYYWLFSGGVYAFAESIETMAKNLAEVKPTMILVVPRVLDRIFAKVKSGLDGASAKKRLLIDWAIGVGKARVKAIAKGKGINPILAAQVWLAEKLVFKKLREKIGPRLRLVVSGGAPGSANAIEFFNAVGIPTVEGYGLTETTAPATCNRPERVKIGTVGPALPSVEVKIAEDGEILLKGPSIFARYHDNPDATKAAFEDGWFRTGDIGTVDGDGYITITDRKKDLIINAAGKNIAPQRIEALLKTVPMVTQAVVFGDKQKHLVALLTLDETKCIEFATERNWPFSTFAELVELPELQKFLKREIQKLGGQLADYEQIRRFAILPEDLSVDQGELTATLKIKRNVVRNKYKSVIESLYKEASKEPAELAASAR